MQALKIIDVHKGFGATQVLKGIDLAVEAGEFLVLVGPLGLRQVDPAEPDRWPRQHQLRAKS